MEQEILITHIEFSNPRKKLYTLYQRNMALTEISEDTLVHFNISKNSSFNKQEFKDIQVYNERNICLNQAYSYLQRRPHLRAELEKKLNSKKFHMHIIEKTLHTLQQKNYINDDQFIQMFIRDALKRGKDGPLLIKKKLYEKGARITLIEMHLEKMYPVEDQQKIATPLINKKLASLSGQPALKQRQKLQQYGLSRGFEWPILESIFNTLDFSKV